jgi:hypothetical protein
MERAKAPQERWRGHQPKTDLTDVDCRAARLKFERGDGPLALFVSRTKLMQHWADRIDDWLDLKKAMPTGLGLLSSGWLMLSNSTREAHVIVVDACA